MMDHQSYCCQIEPFGYGLSDSTKRKRTIENIVEELHECVKNLGEEEYYLMGHSISGLYTLYWSQIYPDEIKGIIGIDPSVPQMTSKENNDQTQEFLEKNNSQYKRNYKAAFHE